MPRILQTDATEIIQPVLPRDAAGQPIGAIAWNDPDLSVQWRSSASGSWQSITLAPGTVGVWSPGGWVHIGDGVHLLGIPAAAIVPGDSTLIRVAYGSHPPQFDSIDAVIAPPVDVGNGITLAIPRMVVAPLNPGVAAFSMERIASLNATQIRLFRGTQWALVIRDVGDIDPSNTLYFTLKDGDLAYTPDTGAIAQIALPLGGGSGGLIRLNGSPAPNTSWGSLAYETYVDGGVEKKQVVIILDDTATAEIMPATYRYDVKSVGEATTVLDYGRLEVMAEATRATS